MSNVIDAIKKRSSTRGYTPEPLTDTELGTLLHAGLQAPTAANRQEIHFTVVKGDDPVLQELESEKTVCAVLHHSHTIFTTRRLPSSC